MGTAWFICIPIHNCKITHWKQIYESFHNLSQRQLNVLNGLINSQISVASITATGLAVHKHTQRKVNRILLDWYQPFLWLKLSTSCINSSFVPLHDVINCLKIRISNQKWPWNRSENHSSENDSLFLECIMQEAPFHPQNKYLSQMKSSFVLMINGHKRMYGSICLHLD